mgnify:CR=1 FL=1
MALGKFRFTGFIFYDIIIHKKFGIGSEFTDTDLESRREDLKEEEDQ